MPQTPPEPIPQRPSPRPAPRPALTLDVARYQAMLDAPDLSEDQKREMIEALWLLVVSFLDLGVDIRPQDFCGKPYKSGDAIPDAREAMLYSDHSKTSDAFARAANNTGAPRLNLNPKKEAS